MMVGGSASAVATHVGPLAHTVAIPLPQLRLQVWLDAPDVALHPDDSRQYHGPASECAAVQDVMAALPPEFTPSTLPNWVTVDARFNDEDGLCRDLALRTALVRALVRRATGRQAYWRVSENTLRDIISAAEKAAGIFPRPHAVDAALRGFVCFCADVQTAFVHSYRAPAWHAAVVYPDVPWSPDRFGAMLQMQVPYRKVIREAGRLIDLQAGFATADADLLQRAGADWLKDSELGRFIPGFLPAREAALREGACLVSLVGGVPAMLVIATDPGALEQAVAAAEEVWTVHTIATRVRWSSLRLPRPEPQPSGDGHG